MAELLFTTDAFRPLDRSVQGVPLLLDSGMRLIEPACSWLMHIALVRGRTRSPQTWRAYGEALYDWWQTLEANGWAWDRVSYHEVAAYRDRMLTGPSDHTGRPYARATINGRLRIVALFYRWCAARGLVEAEPFTTQDISVARWRPAPFLVHVDASGGVRSANELVLREVATLPRPLAPEAIRRILAPLGTRDRLIVDWAAMTGMRRMELAGFGKAALPHTGSVEFASVPLVPVRLDVAKGGRVRRVYPPLPLMDRTHAYLREERAVAVRHARQRSAGYREPAMLFLTAHWHPDDPAPGGRHVRRGEPLCRCHGELPRPAAHLCGRHAAPAPARGRAQPGDEPLADAANPSRPRQPRDHVHVLAHGGHRPGGDRGRGGRPVRRAGLRPRCAGARTTSCRRSRRICPR